MTHKHRKRSERGPFCCKGSVYWVHVCGCGAERSMCSCHQCREQGTSVGEWAMPRCDACGLRHPKDQPCWPLTAIQQSSATDLAPYANEAEAAEWEG